MTDDSKPTRSQIEGAWRESGKRHLSSGLGGFLSAEESAKIVADVLIKHGLAKENLHPNGWYWCKPFRNNQDWQVFKHVNGDWHGVGLVFRGIMPEVVGCQFFPPDTTVVGK